MRAPRVLVTRSRRQASDLSRHLAAAGAVPVEAPVIAVRALEDVDIEALVAAFFACDILVFTSANAVERAQRLLSSAGVTLESTTRRLVASGPGTAAAASGFGDAQIPRRYVAEGVVELLLDQGVQGQRVLIPRALQAREELPERLRDAGAHVDVVPVYESVPDPVGAEVIAAALRDGIDLVTVASSLSTTFLARCCSAADAAKLRGIPFASIGPITTATARELEFDVVVEADPSTAESLARCAMTWLTGEGLCGTDVTVANAERIRSQKPIDPRNGANESSR